MAPRQRQRPTHTVKGAEKQAESKAVSRSAEMARAYKSELVAKLFGVSAQAMAGESKALTHCIPLNTNFLGFGYGAKVTEGAMVSEQTAIRVYVRAKIPRSELHRTELVPGDVNGMVTDVIAVGDITALLRPTLCGVSIGHKDITAGTLGCLVRKNGSGKSKPPLILSNNHVLADSNNGAISDPILEPGPSDGGNVSNPIGLLDEFEPIDFSGSPNSMDAAVAKLVKPSDVIPEIVNIGNIVNPTAPASLYQSVRKRGRTTRHTVGVVLGLSEDIRVRYGGRIAEFDDQLAIVGVGGPFSQGGDSGSLIVDAVTRNPVALLFAGGGGTTFANRIDPILSRFGISIVN